MYLVCWTILALCASIPVFILALAIYRLTALAKDANRSIEMQTNLHLDLKVFSVAALCYLKTLYDKEKHNTPTNPADDLILAAEQMTTAVLVEAGLNARAYNLRSILEAIHQIYSRQSGTGEHNNG